MVAVHQQHRHLRLFGFVSGRLAVGCLLVVVVVVYVTAGVVVTVTAAVTIVAINVVVVKDAITVVTVVTVFIASLARLRHHRHRRRRRHRRCRCGVAATERMAWPTTQLPPLARTVSSDTNENNHKGIVIPFTGNYLSILSVTASYPSLGLNPMVDTFSGLWCGLSGQWSVVSGQWSVVN